MRKLLICIAAVSTTTAVKAAPITHVPGDRVPPVVVSPPFGALAVNGALGTNYISYGVDYTFGGVEGIFTDPPLAFSGVNQSNVVDLIAPVDGRIVTTGTTDQGLTNFVSVLAGLSDVGTLRLDVFDLLGNLIQSVSNSSSGLSTFSITRPNFDIAFFRVSTPGNDSFGVQSVTIESPISAAPIPEPATLAVFGGLALAGAVGYRRRKATAIV